MPAVGSTTPALGAGQISSGEVSETGALIDLILKRFHETHRREGSELSRLAARLEAGHTGDANWPMGLAALTERIMGELVTHMAKEEIVVFPRMRRGGGAPLDRPLAVLHAEHGDNQKDMAILRQMTNAYTPPASADPDWRALYAGLAKFADDLAEHIRLEDGVLFPRFEAQPAEKASGDRQGTS